jgi:hypothetical protein
MRLAADAESGKVPLTDFLSDSRPGEVDGWDVIRVWALSR